MGEKKVEELGKNLSSQSQKETLSNFNIKERIEWKKGKIFCPFSFIKNPFVIMLLVKYFDIR